MSTINSTDLLKAVVSLEIFGSPISVKLELLWAKINSNKNHKHGLYVLRDAIPLLRPSNPHFKI